ncbi:Mbov_0399 family ICE element protein [Mesomycoplasma lagogenitalium]|uniref:ICEF-II n=1 Tax=Mesomycoplasma lagogenitalium TaxID=171286 RepID=A0ABY8LSR0_9BACT|nr:hypothetical protein [Mesomycoplasma lagogenitalium]WGI36295.1 hypothetical protein QEG99_02335 [Mesomycoplasma lagogenitalium]
MKNKKFLFSFLPLTTPLWSLSALVKTEKENLENSKINLNYSFNDSYNDEKSIYNLLNKSLANRPLNSIDNYNKPFTRFYNGIYWNKKTANHEYTSKRGGAPLFNWENILNSGTYGANINIAMGLEGYGHISLFNWGRKEYIGSKHRPNGLDYDNGDFAIQSTNNKINALDNSVDNLQFSFGLESDNPNNNKLQFSDYGSYGLNLSDFVFKKLKEKVAAYKMKYNSAGKYLKSLFISNLKIELNFKIHTDETNNIYEKYSRIKSFKVKVSYKVDVNYDLLKTEQLELLNSISAIQKTFNSEFIEPHKKITINSDTGSLNGLYTKNDNSYFNSNLYFLEQKIKDFWDNKLKINNKNLFKFKYSTRYIRGYEYLKFYIEYVDKIQNKVQTLILDDKITINYKNTDKYENKNINERLIIIPSKYLDFTDIKTLNLKNDIPKLKENSKNPLNKSSDFGGHWIYNAPVKLIFKAAEAENEILLINDKPIDVLDKNFYYDLDYINDHDSDENIYKIELISFDKKDIYGENKKEIYRWTMIIEISKNYSNLNAKWFAWNPNIHPEQKELITPFLVDENGENYKDKNGDAIKNPKYDPLINPETGLKSEIVWVDYSDNLNLLPSNTRFFQDPIDENKKLVKNIENINTGFIAEAIVAGKGVNLTINQEYEIIQLFKVKNEYNSFKLEENKKMNKKVLITNSQNNYFSSSGLWLFSYRTKNGMDAYKLILIGDYSPKKTFSEIYVNSKISAFFQSKQGMNLKNFLIKKKNIVEKEIYKLSYSNIIKFWKEYINDAYSHLTTDQNFFILINPLINERKIKDFFLLQNKENFDINLLNKNDYLMDFENKNLIEYRFNLHKENKNLLEIHFNIKKELLNGDYILAKKYEIISIVWKNEDDADKQLLNDESKTKITPSFNYLHIKQYLNNISFSEFENNWITDQWFNFENKNKTFYDLTIENNKLIFDFKIIEQFNEQFYIKNNEKILTLDLSNYNFIKSENIFKNINIDEIKLNGIENKQEIENEIISFLENTIDKKYKYKVDYVIENFETKIDEIANLTNQSENDFAFIKLKSMSHNNLAKVLKIFNFLNKERTEIINYNIKDLKIDDIELEDDHINQLSNLILNNVNFQLSKYNISIPEDLIIENFNNKVLELKINKNKWILFKIKGKNQHIKSDLTFRVYLKSSNSETTIDLSYVKINEIKISETNLNNLKQKIKQMIEKQLSNISLRYDEHYVIENIDNEQVLKKLISNIGNNYLNFNIISSKNPSIKGKSQFTVINYLTNEQFNNIKRELLNKNQQVKNYWWILSVFLIITPVLSIVFIKIYKKFFKNKSK